MMYFARWKVTTILAVLALGCIFAFPNLLPARISDAIPSWLPHERVSLSTSGAAPIFCCRPTSISMSMSV